MVESNKKNLWIGLGAVGALVAAAMLWHYVNNDGDDDEEAATP